jgi:hypothetical protein
MTPRSARADDDDAKKDAKPAEAKTGNKPDEKADSNDSEKKDAEPPSRVVKDKDGVVSIKLDDETQKRLGLKVETIPASQFTPELKAYGTIVDPSAIAALMNELAVAKAAHKASSNELARLQTLSGTGNASARALQSAEAAALRDLLQVQSAHDRLLLGWGREIADHEDIESFTRSLTTLDTVLARLNLPAGVRLETPPAKARLSGISGNSAEGEFLAISMGVDPQTQSPGYIYQIKQSQAKFLPGESITGFLATKGDPFSGEVIPREAILRVDGRGWVYVETAGDTFTRREIPLELPTEAGWFVTNGIKAADKVVLTGAQSIYSEEVKPAGAPAD